MGASDPHASGPLATVESGRLLGSHADGADAFLGIPYAASPIGDLRFAPPAPAPSWPGVREATRPGPAAPQGRSRLEAVMGARSPDCDEDGCLTVNVWSPTDTGDEPLPVLLWLHGGGFTSGSGGWDWYDGARLAAAGRMVVVTANYRLGPLGYLYLPEAGIANLGVRDQACALRWVVRNVAAFGGDPHRITLGGQSAGAYSALYLGMHPEHRHDVCGLLLQSGPFGLAPQPPDEARSRAARLLSLLGVPDGPNRSGPLRDLAAAAIIDRYAGLMAETARVGSLAPPMYPVLGEFGTERPWRDAVRDGALGSIPVLAGTVRDEATAFLAPELRPPESGPTLVASMTASVFADDTRELLDLHAAAGGPSFGYRFDRAPSPDPAHLGATHCCELPFVFDRLEAYAGAPMLGPVADVDTELAHDWSRAVGGFVRTGVFSDPRRDS